MVALRANRSSDGRQLGKLFEILFHSHGGERNGEPEIGEEAGAVERLGERALSPNAIVGFRARAIDRYLEANPESVERAEALSDRTAKHRRIGEDDDLEPMGGRAAYPDLKKRGSGCTSGCMRC